MPTPRTRECTGFSPPTFLALLSLASVGCRTPIKTVDTDCQPIEEIPYDGVDQDCDGQDLTDVDGDGFDAFEVGGEDCDDSDATVSPGATEEWYDGIDQDCDGADLTDVDGDGYDAIEVGGDDCDDQDASVFPGASEVLGDGTDQDCDGLVDEHLVCADGSGHYTLIQDAIDDVADGSVIEICPGNYSERLTLSSRTLEITGGGDLPEDVLLTPPTGGAGIFVDGGALRLSNLTIEAAPNEEAIHVGDSTAIEVDLVDFCGSGYAGRSYVFDSPFETSTNHITRCNFCDALVSIFGEAQISGNVFGRYGISFNRTGGFWGEWVVHNNIFVCDNAIAFYLGGSASVYNNTMVDSFCFYAQVGSREVETMVEASIRDNIFYSLHERPPWNSSMEEAALWGVWWSRNVDTSRGAPDVWQSNVLWDIGYPEGMLCQWDYSASEVVCDSSYLSTFIAGRSIQADPIFAPDASQGSFALAPTSPAIDAGTGDPDVDGSRNDLGAFGGPDGDWYLEVPWLP